MNRLGDALDEVIEELPVEYRQWLRWCIHEYDPTNPYHDAPDDTDYGTDFPTHAIAVRWGLTLLAGMPDATYGLKREGG